MLGVSPRFTTLLVATLLFGTSAEAQEGSSDTGSDEPSATEQEQEDESDAEDQDQAETAATPSSSEQDSGGQQPGPTKQQDSPPPSPQDASINDEAPADGTTESREAKLEAEPKDSGATPGSESDSAESTTEAEPATDVPDSQAEPPPEDAEAIETTEAPPTEADEAIEDDESSEPSPGESSAASGADDSTADAPPINDEEAQGETEQVSDPPPAEATTAAASDSDDTEQAETAADDASNTEAADETERNDAATEQASGEDQEQATSSPSPTEAATAAQSIHSEHCADVAARDNSIVARAVHTVSATWLQVSDAYKASPEPYLLYWRGVLGACLGQEDRAIEDLQAFVDQSADEGAYSAMVREARRRVRRLNRQPGASASADTAIRREKAKQALRNGIGLGLFSAASGVVSGLLWRGALAVGDELERRAHEESVAQGWQDVGEALAISSPIVGGVAAGAGLASTIVIIASIGTLANTKDGAQGTAGRTRRAPMVEPWVAGGTKGLMGGIQARW